MKLSHPYCTNGRGWTSEEDAALTMDWLGGLPVRTIADHLERTTSAVQTRARCLKIYRPNRPKQEYIPREEQFSPAWCREQNARFCAAMEANPTERPSNMQLKDEPPYHRIRRHPIFLPARACSLEMV